MPGSRPRPRPFLSLALAAGITAGLAVAGWAPPCAAQEAPAQDTADDATRWAALAAERLPLEVCRLEGAPEDFLCGTLSVWENRETKRGRKIDLAVIVVPAKTATPEPDALVPIAGGPGGSVTNGAPFIVRDPGIARLRERRDILLVDQRGTGGSHLLQCTFGVDPADPQSGYHGMFPAELVAPCREALEKDADLTQYTTSIAADDLDEVRRWLGYDRLNLFGGSYGTRAAMEYLRRHPEGARLAILQGVVSMDQRMPLQHAEDGQRSMDLLLTLCAEDPACAAAFPHAQEELFTVMARLDREPGRATVAHPQTGEPVELTVSRGVFAEALRSHLYQIGSSAEVPFLIHRAYQGDFAPFFKATLPWRFFIELELAQGLYLSITCAEDVPFFTAEDAARENAGTYLGGYRTDLQMAACARWPRAEIPAGFRDPVATDVPVLILDGPLDPVTPPRYGRVAAAHMPNSRFVLVPGAHHAFDFPDGGGGCIDGITRAFIEAGSVAGLDTTCVDGLERPPFVLEEAEMGYMESDDDDE